MSPMKSQKRICFIALENVYYACHLFFFSPFPLSGHNSFCVSLLKSSRIWTFSWHLLLREHRQKWLAYWEQPALRDEESVWFAKGLKTIIRTRALNKWVLMKCSHQDNTFLCVLHPGCLVQVCGGSQRNLNPYLSVTAIFTTKRARYKNRHRGGYKNKYKAEEGLPWFSVTTKTQPSTTTSPSKGNLIEISNIATFPFCEGQVASAVDWLDSTQG